MNPHKSHLKQGQRLEAVWGPQNQEGQIGYSVNLNENVEAITVSQLAGPMGWYDVAVVTFHDGQNSELFPLHMMEQIDFYAGGANMTTECVCPNCRQLFQSSSLSRVADYCSECWDAWRQGNGSFERRAKDATIKQLVEALKAKVEQLEKENDLLRRQIKHVETTWHGLAGHMELALYKGGDDG
ncbi:hypothetical protein OU789_10995 [Halocynthiibacter sp. C4]|uniref:hypothetical protein n=1 Tax=Halocynthiibacter sp. C4 TaxID=2992758 RepID=UPI00237C0E8A|nr:hypothetical protein [Halocynthiibacter sp. C4]MDE0590454.1 hypothetical protein [Halocynthiibacter sp. C4]